MYSGQAFIKTFFTPRSNPYMSNEINNIRTHSSSYIRKIHLNTLSDMRFNISDFTTKFKAFCEKSNLLNMVKININSVPKKLKNESVTCVKTWTRQCECVSAQQIRRGQQMFSLYTKLWEERALKEFFKIMRQNVLRRGKQFIIGAVGISVFDWDKNRIHDTEMLKHIQDLSYIELLKKEDLNCKCCEKRKLVDFADPNVDYCKCPGDKNSKNYKDNWQPYLERKDLIVWRRQRPSGIFEYKVYGSYNDVTAMDFLRVQVDINYRQKWDNTAIALQVIETENETNSDMIYWEMQWPRLFANRDYVFSRRYVVKEDSNMILLCSKGSHHPTFPPKKDKYRITEYYSCMVIRPTNKMTEPGIEFSLTYFDNPGVNIPATVTSWVAMSAMPDFLSKLRIAAREYKDYCKKNYKQCKILTDNDAQPTSLTTPQAQVLSNDMSEENTSYWRYLQPHYYFG